MYKTVHKLLLLVNSVLDQLLNIELSQFSHHNAFECIVITHSYILDKITSEKEMMVDQRLAEIKGIEYSLREQNQSRSKATVVDQSQVYKGLKTITYTADQLRCIKVKVDHDKKLKIIGNNTVNTIRKLRIYKRKTR